MVGWIYVFAGLGVGGGALLGILERSLDVGNNDRRGHGETQAFVARPMLLSMLKIGIFQGGG